VGSVLVHCAAGKSRSASLVIAYLMREFKWKYEEAFNYVKSKRSIVQPNPGFVKLLKNCEITFGVNNNDKTDELNFLLIECAQGRIATARVSKLLVCVYGDETVEIGMLKAKVAVLSNYLEEPLKQVVLK